MTRSTNGGMSWQTPALAPSGGATGLGGQPVVRPNGTVIVPYRATNASEIRSFRSIDGGASWRSTVLVSSVSHHTVAGGLRESPLPSAEIDSAGTAYVAWADCRFRSGCPRNDIVISESTSETTWAAPYRVPTDATTSTVEHFAPGIGVDPSTAGGTAKLGLTYYSYASSSCTACQLNVSFISSTNGGTNWSPATQIAGPMFGDYISTSIAASGRAYPVLPIATAPAGSTFNLAAYVPAGGLAIAGGLRASAGSPVASATAAAVPAAPVHAR
jgi:hypothetical protein